MSNTAFSQFKNPMYVCKQHVLPDIDHKHRTQKGVSEALLRLYSPFLWCALKVANPDVRANAAAVLLQDPDALREETNLFMQRQFD